jgi:hypothetical protein
MKPAYDFGDLAIISPAKKAAHGDEVVLCTESGIVYFGQIDLSDDLIKTADGVPYSKKTMSVLNRYNSDLDEHQKEVKLIASDYGRKIYDEADDETKEEFKHMAVRWMYPVVDIRKHSVTWNTKLVSDEKIKEVAVNAADAFLSELNESNTTIADSADIKKGKKKSK